jgi:nicotinamidase/pyrazinamidase
VKTPSGEVPVPFFNKELIVKALVLVDLQNDFVPGGALGVPAGDQVVPVANRVQSAFDLVVATQDWHPANHGSFAANHPGRKPGEIIELEGLEQILWPVHCVENTKGAEFLPGLDLSRVAEVFRKGVDPNIDSYSAFFDNAHRRATGLGQYLRQKGVGAVYIMGLATDYCVKFTSLDARQLAFDTYVIEDGCRGVELNPGDVEQALGQMREAGVQITKSNAVLKA